MKESKSMTAYRGQRNNAKLWKALCIRMMANDLTREEYVTWLELCTMRHPTDEETEKQTSRANDVLGKSVEG